MWYIEFNNNLEKQSGCATGVVDFFQSKGNESTEVWILNFLSPDNLKSIKLPFSYEDFKTIFTEAARKHEIPDFRQENHENLRAWLKNFRECQKKRRQVFPRSGDPSP